MNSPITGFPAGLLSLIGSNTFGQSPRELGGVVAPTIELIDLYLAPKLEVAFNPGVAAIAAGQNTGAAYTITVPTGETWFVRAISCFLSTAVGEAVTAQPWIQLPTSAGGTMSIGNPTTLGASTTGWSNSTIAPLFVPSGTRFGIWGSGVTGAPSGAVTALIARLRG